MNRRTRNTAMKSVAMTNSPVEIPFRVRCVMQMPPR
jgi:hypothetical protein